MTLQSANLVTGAARSGRQTTGTEVVAGGALWLGKEEYDATHSIVPTLGD